MKYLFYSTILVLLVIACQSNNETPAEHQPIANEPVNNSTITIPSLEVEEEEEEFENEMPSRIFKWTGKINGSINIHGQYQIANGFMDSGMDILVGELIYDKVGKPIKIIGQLENGGASIRLLEMDKKGNVTGILSGKWQNGSITEGNWFSPNKQDNFSLAINATPQDASNYKEKRPKNIASIVGKYHYEYGKEGYLGTIHVQSVKENQVSFDVICLTAAPGRNIASLEEAVAPISNYTINVDRSENCQFNIRFFDDFAVVDYVNDKLDCQFGHNAHVSGIFKKIE